MDPRFIYAWKEFKVEKGKKNTQKKQEYFGVKCDRQESFRIKT